MAGPKLKAILKDKTKQKFFHAFLKEKRLENELIFITGRTAVAEVYDTFFHSSPKVKLKLIDGQIKKARQIFEDVLDACAKKGMKPSEAYPVATNNKVMAKLYESALRVMNDAFENKVIPAFEKSPYYERFLESQICGSSLASQLKFPANAAKDLANAKYFMIIGQASKAKSYVKSAINYWIENNRKTAKKRDGLRAPKEADVIKGLQRIRVAV